MEKQIWITGFVSFKHFKKPLLVAWKKKHIKLAKTYAVLNLL